MIVSPGVRSRYEVDGRVDVYSLKIRLGFEAEFSKSLPNFLYFELSSALSIEP
jgi:hypothetical protein